MDAVTQFNASDVIIPVFLNHGDGVWTGFVASSKIIGSSNTDGMFFICGISTFVLLCLLVFNISFYLSTLSTGALIVGWNLVFCASLT